MKMLTSAFEMSRSTQLADMPDTSAAGCNTNNSKLIIVKEQCACSALVNSGSQRSYDTDEFQANIPYEGDGQLGPGLTFGSAAMPVTAEIA